MSKDFNIIELDTSQPYDVIQVLSNRFEVPIVTDCDEHVIKLPTSKDKLTVTGVDFHDGYGVLSWKGVLNRDFTLKFVENQKHPLRFLFCLEGHLTHFLNDQSIQYQLNPLRGSITTSPNHSVQLFRFPTGVPVSISSLVIHREIFLEKVECNLETLPSQLSKIFRDTKSSSTFFYEGNYSIATSECIKKIHDNHYKGLVRMTYLESKALELLTYQLKQYKDDQEPSQRQVLLRKYDVDKIIQAKEYMLKNLQKAPNIKEMARQVGINENKLKRGFKLIFDFTINQYLRNERLELAKLLLMENDRSVQEVAEMVGYRSKGHFSYRFKEKFGMLPKDFVKNLHSKINELDIKSKVLKTE